MSGTGFRLMATADVVFVCQASSSRVLLVDLTVCGEVCCTSLKRALQARLNLAIAMMYLSTALVSSGTGSPARSLLPLVPGSKQLPGSEPPLALWLDLGVHQRLLDGFPLLQELFVFVNVEHAEFNGEPL